MPTVVPRLSRPADTLRAPIAAALCLLLGACAAPAPTQPRSVTLSSANCPKPVYPAEARQQGAEGTTEMSFDVDAAGKVTRAAIVRGSGESAGHRLLDAAAIDLLQKCTFPPAPGFLTGSGQMAYVWRLKD